MMQSRDAVSPSLSRAVYFDILREQEYFVKVDVYADIVDVTSLIPRHREKGIANKKKMRGFSNQSRHAMIEFLAKVVEVPDLFVTMTYSDDIANDWYLNLRNNFEAFRHRLERYYPNIRAMWRVEFVPRKSGRLYGQFIPHLHLLVWLPENVTPEQRESILKDEGQLWRNWWHSITHSTDDNHLAKYGCLVEPIRSRKHAYAYCSKYLAKETYEEIEFGRRWGRIGHFEQPTMLETELNYREYVHFKRLLAAFLKAEAHKRFKRQKFNIPYPAIPLSYYMGFYHSFVKLPIRNGLSVFGTGFLSQENPLGIRTIYRMIRHARQLAQEEREK